MAAAMTATGSGPSTDGLPTSARVVIIGGGVARAGDLILGPCRAAVPDMVLAAEAKNVPIVEAELGTLAAAVGAACLAREEGREEGRQEGEALVLVRQLEFRFGVEAAATWRERVLGPVLTVQALLLQILHATAISGWKPKTCCGWKKVTSSSGRSPSSEPPCTMWGLVSCGTATNQKPKPWVPWP